MRDAERKERGRESRVVILLNVNMFFIWAPLKAAKYFKNE